MLFDIYELVHSLTKAEKRYFQRAASAHVIGEKNNYLRLFEVLNQQKQLNEALITEQFRGQHLYLLKRHLQRSLLKSLRMFHSATSVTIQIHTMITEVEVLYKKGLIKAALKSVHHAKKVALRHEQSPALLQLLEWEVKLLSVQRKLVQSRNRISHAFEEADRQLSFYKNFLDCFHLRMDVSALHNKEVVVRRSFAAEDQKKIIRSIKTLGTKNLSGKARWELYNGAGTFFSTLGDYNESHAYHRKAARISEDYSFLVSDELRQYLLSLYSQGISYYYLKKYTEALENLKIIRDMISPLSNKVNKKDIQELFLHTLLLEGFILMDMGRYALAQPVINELARKMETHAALASTSLRTDFYYQQTGFWFCVGDFRRAQTSLAKILQDEEAPKENSARYRFARLMQLLVLLELKEFREIRNLLPATKKFLQKKNQRFKVEECLLDFIVAYAKDEDANTERPDIERFSALKKKLLRLAKDKKEATALRVFNYIAWAESKIQNKPISDLP